uniref:Uncharacterized protein n=1 Tax=Solanum lycopersicum TaxID=4081 RepID=A0A3Q7FSY0_SOLLC
MERDTWNEQNFLTIGIIGQHAKLDCLYCIRGSNLETVLSAIASLCGSISAAASAMNEIVPYQKDFEALGAQFRIFAEKEADITPLNNLKLRQRERDNDSEKFFPTVT